MADKKKSLVAALSRPDQMIANTVKMRGLGTDDPIEWDAFGTVTGPRPKGKNSLLKSLLQPGLETAGAETENVGSSDGRQGVINSLLMKLIALGAGDFGYKPQKRQARELPL